MPPSPKKYNHQHHQSRGARLGNGLPEFPKLLAVVVGTFGVCLICYLAIQNYNDTVVDPDTGKRGYSSSGKKSNIKNRFDSPPHHKAAHAFLEQCASLLSASSSGDSHFPVSPMKEFVKEQYCEGYYRLDLSEENGQQQRRQKINGLPFPEAHSEKFCGQDEFLKLVQRLEEGNSYEITVSSTRGLAMSRLEKDKLLGSNKEFSGLTNARGYVCWTGDFSSYYMKKFNVRPSIEFVRFILEKA